MAASRTTGVKRRAREALFQSLWRAGYELKRLDGDGWSPENLRKEGLAPKTVIDVGVGTGTPGLHEAFPDAHHVFVEALQEFEPDLRRLVATFGGEYHVVAAGASAGEIVMAVDTHIPMQSSIHARVDDDGRALAERTVEVATLDDLAAGGSWQAPFGIKIDVEGYEAEVVAGATAILCETQFVIAELSISERFAGSVSFAGFVQTMDRHGFRLCDLLTAPKGRDRELIQVDAMFRR